MPRRNLVWLLVVAALGAALWVYPQTILRRDMLYRDFGALLDVQALITKRYVEPVDNKLLLRGAIRGMLIELDPFSDYFDADEYPQFKKRASGHFIGIGVEVAIVGGYLTVVSPIEDTPAFAKGLRSGDRILEIDGESTQTLTLTQAVNRIGGDAGTTVTLKVWSPGDEDGRDMVITRSLITVPSVKGFRHTDDAGWDYFVNREAGIGYVRLTNFDESTPEQFDRAMQSMYRTGLRALVIDLRDNPGGLLKTAVAIADRFLSRGPIVSTRGRESDEEVWSAAPDDDYPKQIPIAILINDGSASASEILSGALHDHHRAVLVGEKSFGKGSVQNLIEMNNGESALKLTTAYYYLPKGERIHKIGVAPDYEVKLTRAEKQALMLERAIPTTTRATTSTAAATTRSASTQPTPDRQLDKAVDVLLQTLNGSTGATTRPTSAPLGASATRTAERRAAPGA